MVLLGAHVFTADPGRPWAEAVAIRGGRVVGVGDRSAVAGMAAASTRVLRFEGCLVLPAFQDAHVHPIGAGLVRARCDLHEVAGVEAYAVAVAEFASRHPDRPWIRGGGWSMEFFPSGNPRKEVLDRVVADRPVLLVSRDGHSAWVNSRALEEAGIGASTPDPADGYIVRDEDGSPTGALHEGAIDLVARASPAIGFEEHLDALTVAQAQLHAWGVTAWQDAWTTAVTLPVYRALAERGHLTGRVVACLLWDNRRGEEQIDELLELRAAGTAGRLRAGTVKILLDGILENATASLLEPYLDERGEPTGNRGIDMIDPEELRRCVTLLDRAGFQVHMHALGDGAVRSGLDAVQATRERNGDRDLRHTIAHLQLVHPLDVPRFAQLGVVANAQPLWAYEDAQMRRLVVPFIGEERRARQYPLGSLARSGARLAFGSDWPVSTGNPMPQLEVAIRRADPWSPENGPVLAPEERLDLASAVRAFTSGSAFVNRLDRETGSITEGRLADLVVVDRDLFTVPDQRVGRASVLLTLSEGEVVHAAERLEA